MSLKPDELREIVRRYVSYMSSGDADAIVELYAEDGAIEDPVGAEPRQGKAELHAWYKASAGSVDLQLTGPIRVAGDQAAFPLVGKLGADDDPSYIDIIDVARFDAAGKIVKLSAHWSMDQIRK